MGLGDVTRQCIRCGRQITACNGFGLARDWGKRVPIREHCGWCVEWMEQLTHQQRREYLLSLD
jgi:hypothetical protein